MKTKKKKMRFDVEDYIKANKKLAREEELQRNGGRWVAKDRPHKNLKKYDRKRDRKNFDSYLSLFSFNMICRAQMGIIAVKTVNHGYAVHPVAVSAEPADNGTDGVLFGHRVTDPVHLNPMKAYAATTPGY